MRRNIGDEKRINCSQHNYKGKAETADFTKIEDFKDQAVQHPWQQGWRPRKIGELNPVDIEYGTDGLSLWPFIKYLG